MTALDVALPDRAHHGEGPVWDGRTGRLLWVDITAGLVHAWDPVTSQRERIDLGRDVGCVAPLAAGGVIAGVRDGIVALDERGREHPIVAPLAQDPNVRMNDGACDPDGRFWTGSMAYDMRPGGGALYRLDHDGRLATVLRDVTISNGLAWSPDGRHCYYIDSATGGVDRFEYRADDGSLAGRTRIVDVPSAAGDPDGLTVDAEGCLWVALWDGGQVRRYDPAGRLLTTLELPVARVTSCAFGGADLGSLYITTSRFGLTAAQLAEQPLAGALFVADPGVRGLVSPPCTYGVPWGGPGGRLR